jgi:hypothetical protein
MAVDGTWKLTVNTPMGPQQSTLTISANGNALTGTQSAGHGDGQPIADGKVSGDNVSWSSSITRPMPMTLAFSGTVNGDTISGSVKLGMFGTQTFTGTRG